MTDCTSAMHTILDKKTQATITVLGGRGFTYLCTFQGCLYTLHKTMLRWPLPTEAHVELPRVPCKSVVQTKKPTRKEKIPPKASWVLRNDRQCTVAELYPTVTPVVRLYPDKMKDSPFRPGDRSLTKRFWAMDVVGMIQRWWRKVAPSGHKRLALCMGMHQRLGTESVVFQLPVELMEKISAMAVF